MPQFISGILTDPKKRLSVKDITTPTPQKRANPLQGVNLFPGLKQEYQNPSRTQQFQHDPGTLQGAMARIDREFPDISKPDREAIKYTLQRHLAERPDFKGDLLDSAMKERVILRQRPDAVPQRDTQAAQLDAAYFRVYGNALTLKERNRILRTKSISGKGTLAEEVLALDANRAARDEKGYNPDDPLSAWTTQHIAKPLDKAAEWLNEGVGMSFLGGPRGVASEEAKAIASFVNPVGGAAAVARFDPIAGAAAVAGAPAFGRSVGSLFGKAATAFAKAPRVGPGFDVAEGKTASAGARVYPQAEAEADLAQARRQFGAETGPVYDPGTLPGVEMRPAKGVPKKDKAHLGPRRDTTKAMPKESLPPWSKPAEPAPPPVKDDMLDLLTQSVENVKAKKGITEPPVTAQNVRPTTPTGATKTGNVGSVKTPKPVKSKVEAGTGTTPKPVSGASVEPWQITRLEARKPRGIAMGDNAEPMTTQFAKWDAEHRAAVEQALAEGKPVPDAVLKDYPDLVKGKPSTAPKAKTPEKLPLQATEPKTSAVKSIVDMTPEEFAAYKASLTPKVKGGGMGSKQSGAVLVPGKEDIKVAADRLGNLTKRVFNTPRTALATADISASFRQGGYFLGKNIKGDVQVMRRALEAIKDPAISKAVEDVAFESPAAKMFKKWGLDLQHHGGEDFFQESLVDWVPGAKQVKDASERHFNTFMNLQRMQTMLDFVKRNPGLDDAVYNQYAASVNSATGRSNSLKAMSHQELKPILDAMFFSPNLMAARIETSGQVLNATWKLVSLKANAAEKEILKDFTRFFVSRAGILAAGTAAGVWTLDTKYDSPTFGKVRIGKTWHDPWAGFLQNARLVMQMASAESTYEYGAAMGRWMGGKTAPNIRLALELKTGKDFFGKKITKGQAIGDALTPLGVQTFLQTLGATGSVGEAAAAAGSEFVGFGTSPDRPPKAKGSRSPRKISPRKIRG